MPVPITVPYNNTVRLMKIELLHNLKQLQLKHIMKKNDELSKQISQQMVWVFGIGAFL